MQDGTYVQNKLKNSLHALAIFAAMTGLLALMGRIVFGGLGLVVMAASGATALMFTPRISPRLVLRLYNARPLSRNEAPGLYDLVRELARRAGLAATPEVFYVRSNAINAFSVGTRKDAALAVSDGLLRSMNGREITGILAHEMSHVRAGDMWVMGLADMMSRLTSFLSMLGLALLLINLPLLLTGEWTISWWLILLLIFSPNIAAFLQLGLSRSREYNADLEAARLTGDPEGLASALHKLDAAEKSLLARLLLPGRKVPSPSVLRTHPRTSDRVRRLMELAGKYAKEDRYSGELPHPPGSLGGPPRRPPRGRISGLWY
jgi:heat shock protein HtpX